MPRKCSICTSPKRGHINRALISGKRRLREIAEKYGYSISALHRHKHHISRDVQVAKKADVIEQGRTAYELFAELLDEAEKRYRVTRKGSLKISWFREWRTMMEIGFKLGIEEARRREQKGSTKLSPELQEIMDKLHEDIHGGENDSD
ncbi:MAG TPA: hypothetical protein ENI27_03900 [bacterium]|nr:hypothetical protein [bacterium]